MSFINQARINHIKLKYRSYRRKLCWTLGDRSVQHIEASERVNFTQIKLHKDIPICTHRNQTCTYRSPCTLIDTCNITIKHDDIHMSHTVSLEQLIECTQCYLGNHRGIESFPLRKWTRRFSHFIFCLCIFVEANFRNHIKQWKIILNHELLRFRHIGNFCVLGKTLGIVTCFHHKSEIIHHCRRGASQKFSVEIINLSMLRSYHLLSLCYLTLKVSPGLCESLLSRSFSCSMSSYM